MTFFSFTYSLFQLLLSVHLVPGVVLGGRIRDRQTRVLLPWDFHSCEGETKTANIIISVFNDLNLKGGKQKVTSGFSHYYSLEPDS